jgi:MFS family permease
MALSTSTRTTTNSASKEEDPYHETLKRRPVLFAVIGVLHTLLTAGVVFGWASLLPILRAEGIDLSPGDFARVFTHGAIGNYLSSLPFGLLLDHFGPKKCGITASLLFAIGLILCSFADSSTSCLNIGFGLIGFAGPAIQLPTLHLARLFPGTAGQGGNGNQAAALMMSAQAGAFDGGTIVFALFSVMALVFGMSSQFFFRAYLIVPIFTLLTAIFFWPNEILPDSSLTQKRKAYIGAGSPYLSPATELTGSSSSKLKDAPLSVILKNPPFYCLALWVSVHILKLNFVVATINDQLEKSLADRPDQVNMLIHMFGAILPCGFVVLPLVAMMLTRSTMICFQLANVIGVLYGLVLVFFPNQAWYQVLIVFTSVATSRQLVYSTVFHQTSELFGFQNYGVLLGLVNCVVSLVSLVQGPLVEWAEAIGGDYSYFWPNVVLLIATVPLFGVVCWTVPVPDNRNNGKSNGLRAPVTETTVLLASPVTGRARSYSDMIRLP